MASRGSAAARRAAHAAAALLLASGLAPALQAQDLINRQVELETASGTLVGTETTAPGSGRRPALLLVSGSGPTDRDGNSPLLPGRNNSLKLLAEALAGAGFTVIRYDKRGVAGSFAAGPAEADLRFETYASDAALWLQRLRSDPLTCSVGVVGHSEGALVGVLAAGQASPAAVVMLAGPARPVSAVLREQLAPQLDSAAFALASSIISRLEAGKTVDTVPPFLWMLFRPSVQPYLISWFRHDPAAIVAELGIPTMAAYGTTDIQVPAADAQVLAIAAPQAELLVIQGMNHVLKDVGPDQAAQHASYSDPSLPLASELVPRLLQFLEPHVTCEGARAR